MKILSSLLLSSTLLTSAVASASPNDHRTNLSTQRVTVRDHRTDRDGWIGRPAPAPTPVWTSLLTMRVSGRQRVIEVDRKVDTLRLEVSRGQLSIQSAVILFADGSKYVAPIDAQMRAGDSQLIQIPGAGKRVARVQLKLARPSKALITLSAK